jgi:hypothetical protein
MRFTCAGLQVQKLPVEVGLRLKTRLIGIQIVDGSMPALAFV